MPPSGGDVTRFSIFHMTKLKAPPDAGRPSPLRKDPRSLLLNVLIILLVVIVGGLAYSLLHRSLLAPPVESARAGAPPGQVIQIDVLNGCGISRAASGVTSYLRARGYDVVEVRNYKTFDVKESLVIDRTGNLETARRVAYALGVKERNIVQQISHEYYVDVSVVVGQDFSSLKASP